MTEAETGSEAPLWMRDESLRPLAARLACAPALPRLVSFDFFDTLVLRLCAEPADLFIEVGRQLARRGLLRIPLTPEQFRIARIAADRRAREAVSGGGRCPEIKLDDIYAQLREVVTADAAARAVELEVERASCFVNPAMVSLVEEVRARGCRTAILSDTYFSSAELLAILSDHGVRRELFDAVLVSCEQGAAKWFAGSIYPQMLRHLELHADEVLHIGDDPGADVHMAHRHGLEVLHYPRATPSTRAVLDGERALAAASVPAAGSVEKLRVLVSRRAESDDDPFRDGALTLGPLLARFADFAVERYRSSGVRRVLALMREGELLGELVRRSAAASGADLEVVTCYASRMATARAALTRIDASSAADLLEGSSGLTPRAILDVLGVADEAYRFPPLLSPQEGRTVLTSPESRASFLDSVFELPRLKAAIEKRHAESLELAFKYLCPLVGDASTIGILDLGWSGSIQGNIGRILRRSGASVRTVGCYLACTARAGRLALDGDVAFAYLPSEWNRNAILFEVCVTACIGSTDGYALNAAGASEPVLGRDDTTPAQKAAKQRIWHGVREFQELWLALRDRPGSERISADLLDDIDRLSPAILARLMDYPTKPEADRLGLLAHDENYFGANFSAPLCSHEAARRLRSEGAQALFLKETCVWPHGVLAQSNPRLMAVLRLGLKDPLALGRLGAWHAASPFDAGITDEELASLAALLTDCAPDQVVHCGPLAPVSLDVFGDLLKQLAARKPPDPASPRLILAGNYPHYGLEGPDAIQVRGVLRDPATLRGIRARLRPGGNVALVLTSDLPIDEIPTLLHALAPFLGPRGAVFLPCGNHDLRTVASESPLAASLNAWFTSSGASLGFVPWAGLPDTRHHLMNWLVVARASAGTMWNRQWMGKVSDFLYDPAPVPEWAEAPVTAGTAR